MRKAGLSSPAHPVLCHAGLKLLDLGVQHPNSRAVPMIFLLPPALPLQLLELQVLVGTLGHIQLFPNLWAEMQKGWTPRGQERKGLGQESWSRSTQT